VKPSPAKLSVCSFVIAACLLAWPAPATELWVSPAGNDRNPGTLTEPLASVGVAQQKAAELRKFSKAAGDGPVNR